MVKANSTYEPSWPSGQACLQFQQHEATESISTPPYMGFQSTAGLPQALNSPVPIYTPGWRQALCRCPRTQNERTNHEATSPTPTVIGA